MVVLSGGSGSAGLHTKRPIEDDVALGRPRFGVGWVFRATLKV